MEGVMAVVIATLVQGTAVLVVVKLMALVRAQELPGKVMMVVLLLQVITLRIAVAVAVKARQVESVIML
jgi:hypothetical protein